MSSSRSILKKPLDIDITLEKGKYHITAEKDMKNFKATRYGEEWQSLTGNKLILALCHRIQELEEVVKLNATPF